MNKNRLEAFSDGVIAIIITIMVFDLKVPELTEGITSENIWQTLLMILPKFISYTVSYVIIAVMWVNHHQILHQIKHVDRWFLWYNILLLFWISLIPFSTNFIGVNPFLAEANLFYGLIFFMNAISFHLLRNYAVKKKLFQEPKNSITQKKAQIKNILAMSLYLVAAFAGFFSVYFSFFLYLIVPIMYFFPEELNTIN